MSCKVSVIIPFYNGIDYLRPCVESVQGQTLREIEILLVDDGSTDGSGELADELAAADARIRVLHQENAGVSTARNTALEIAQGEYIGFVDADDLAEPEMFATLYETAKEKQCDIASCAFTLFDDGGTNEYCKLPFDPETVLTHSQIVRLLPTMSTKRAFQFVWRRIFSAALVREHGVRFDPEISIGEDTLFCTECFLYASRVSVTDRSLYRYRLQPNSALRNRAYKPNLLCSLAKQYEKRKALCAAYCPEELPVFLRDSANRSVEELFSIVLGNVFRKPRGRYRAYRAFLRTRWAQETLQYADIPRSRSLDMIAVRCMQNKLYTIGYGFAGLVYGEKKTRRDRHAL